MRDVISVGSRCLCASNNMKAFHCLTSVRTKKIQIGGEVGDRVDSLVFGLFVDICYLFRVDNFLGCPQKAMVQ